MRSVALLVAVIACGGQPIAPKPVPRHVVPGARLPDDAVPLDYELHLDVDPSRDDFSGSVAIHVRVRATDRVWLHASGLTFGTPRWTQHGVIHPLALAEQVGELVAFDLGEVVTDDIELHLSYTGHTGKDEEGLFRQEDRGKWYLFSQSESVFARRFVPCFDEPRWKTPWTVAIVAPAELAVFSNAPQAATELLPDGRRSTRFAATPPLASYLVAIAVGPFEIVDAGGELPMRVIALAGDADRVGVVAAKAPEMIAALEAYTGSRLPWPKLDFVVVPHLFGAMENPGLITFDRESLVGEGERFERHFIRIAGHELAHMWFGNSVTPRWWDDLWLAESFAQWMANKLATELHGWDDEPLQRGQARARALEADDAVDARALHHVVEHGADAESDFDAISYEKGAALLGSFERLAGEQAFRAALRAYLNAHAGGHATTADLIAAFAKHTTPEIAHALAVDVELAGPPVVTLTPASKCGAIPLKLISTATNGIAPICIRADVVGCVLVDGRKEIEAAVAPRGVHAPAFDCSRAMIANDGGLGYYDSVDDAGTQRTPGEQLARGTDIVDRLHRREIDVARAKTEVLRMSVGDGYAQLGALTIARALAASSMEPAQLATWIGQLFAAHLTSAKLFAPRTDVERAIRDVLLEIAELPLVDAATLAALERDLAGKPGFGTSFAVTIAARTGGRALFDRVVDARARANSDVRVELEESLGTFGADLAPHAVELIAKGDLPIGVALGYLARPATRAAAWPAIRDHLGELLANSSPQQAKDLLVALASLCTARAEVAAAFEPLVATITDGTRTLATTLATIDRCIARR